MSAHLFENLTTTLIANLLIATCWYFSLSSNTSRHTLERRIRTTAQEFLSNGVHILFFLLSIVPYLTNGMTSRLVTASICCLCFAACTTSPRFYAPPIMQYRAPRLTILSLLATISFALAISKQNIAVLPMAYSVVLAMFQFRHRVLNLSDVMEDNQIMRDKLSELSARLRSQRLQIYTPTTHSDKTNLSA